MFSGTRFLFAQYFRVYHCVRYFVCFRVRQPHSFLPLKPGLAQLPRGQLPLDINIFHVKGLLLQDGGSKSNSDLRQLRNRHRCERATPKIPSTRGTFATYPNLSTVLMEQLVARKNRRGKWCYRTRNQSGYGHELGGNHTYHLFYHRFCSLPCSKPTNGTDCQTFVGIGIAFEEQVGANTTSYSGWKTHILECCSHMRRHPTRR